MAADDDYNDDMDEATAEELIAAHFQAKVDSLPDHCYPDDVGMVKLSAQKAKVTQAWKNAQFERQQPTGTTYEEVEVKEENFGPIKELKLPKPRHMPRLTPQAAYAKATNEDSKPKATKTTDPFSFGHPLKGGLALTKVGLKAFEKKLIRPEASVKVLLDLGWIMKVAA